MPANQMKITTSRWTQKGACDCGTYKTTITIAGACTVALTLNGNLTRKQAILAAVRELGRDADRWPADYLRRLYNAAHRRAA